MDKCKNCDSIKNKLDKLKESINKKSWILYEGIERLDAVSRVFEEIRADLEKESKKD